MIFEVLIFRSLRKVTLFRTLVFLIFKILEKLCSSNLQRFNLWVLRACELWCSVLPKIFLKWNIKPSVFKRIYVEFGPSDIYWDKNLDLGLGLVPTLFSRKFCTNRKFGWKYREKKTEGNKIFSRLGRRVFDFLNILFLSIVLGYTIFLEYSVF